MCATRVKNTENSEFEKGRRGVCDLVRLSETLMRVDFEETEDLKAETFQVKVSFGEDGTVPEYVPFKKMKDKTKIKVSATMNKAGDRILFAVPANGYFEVRFDKFVAPEGSAPVIEKREGKPNKRTGKPSIYGKFACLFELTGGMWNDVKIKEGIWAGARYWFGLYDNFAADADGNLAVSGSGAGSDNLNDFLDAVGIDCTQIPMSENPLPEIQRIAQEKDTRFFVNVAKGWVTSLSVPLSFEEEEEIGFSEEPEEKEAEVKEEIHPALGEE